MDQPTPSASDILAHQRTDLAGERTDLAAKRTLMAADRSLMAWIRTALSMIGFGFTIYKFLHGMKADAANTGFAQEHPRNVGLILIGLGTFSIVAGTIEYLGTIKEIRKVIPVKLFRPSLIVASIIASLGTFMFINLLYRLNIL